MDISKYRMASSPKTRPYSVPLPEDVIAILDDARTGKLSKNGTKVHVRASIRDLIIDDFIPKLLAAMESA